MDDQLRNQVSDFVVTFTSILWEAMPFIILGALIAGILEEFLPQQLIRRLVPKNPIAAALIGGLLGLIFPICECGIIVVMRRLLRKGVPISSCVAYMLAGPIVNVVVLLSTYVAFKGHGVGVEMTVLRAVMGFVVGVVTGYIIQLAEKKYGLAALLTPIAMPRESVRAAMSLPLVNDDDDEKPRKKSWLQRLSNISETTLHDFLDITVFLTIGAAVAAFAKLVINPDDIQHLSRDLPYLAIPAMMALAVVVTLCSEADAFVAASFTELSVSSKLAFLVLGPMLDFKLILMYTRVFRTRLILILILCTTIQTGIYSLIVHQLYNPKPGSTAVGSVESGVTEKK